MERKPQPTIKGFGERLQQAIWDADMDISEICRRSGVSRTMLYHYRYHMTQPTAWALAMLAKTLKVTADYLLGIEVDNEN